MTQETEIADKIILTKVLSRNQFLRSLGLGTVIGISIGTSLASLAYELTRPKIKKPETVDPIAVYRTENLMPEEAKKFNDRFDSLLTNLKESNAQKIGEPKDSHQGYQFTLKGRTYALVTTTRNIAPSGNSIDVIVSARILGVTTQEGSLFFAIDQNQFITALRRKPQSTPTLQSITNNGLSIDSDHTEAIHAFENNFEKWKDSNTQPDQPNVNPTPEAL